MWMLRLAQGFADVAACPTSPWLVQEGALDDDKIGQQEQGLRFRCKRK